MIAVALIVIPVAFIVTLEAARIPRDVENVEAHTGRISSTVVKAIIIGIILFICAFLSLYAYWTCIASARPPPSVALYSARPSLALPVSAAVTAANRVGQRSRYVAFPLSRSGVSTPSSSGNISMAALPSVPGKAYAVKTKVTAPTAGARPSSVRKISL